MADPKTPNSPAPTRDAAVAAVVADAAAGQAEGDVSVGMVGTFAAGQSDYGRYVVAAEAPQSSFATGQTEDGPAGPNSPAPTRDAAVAAVVADAAAGQAEGDVSVGMVGTFAAGQSDDGRYVVAAEAPQSSFATGQTEDGPAGPTEEGPNQAPTDAESQHRA